MVPWKMLLTSHLSQEATYHKMQRYMLLCRLSFLSWNARLQTSSIALQLVSVLPTQVHHLALSLIARRVLPLTARVSVILNRKTVPPRNSSITCTRWTVFFLIMTAKYRLMMHTYYLLLEMCATNQTHLPEAFPQKRSVLRTSLA